MHARALIWLLSLAGSALGAHDPGLSSTRATVSGGALRVVVEIANGDAASADGLGLDRDGDGRIDAEELGAGGAAAGRWLAQHVVVHAGERPVVLAVEGTRLADNADVCVELSAALPAGGALRFDLDWLAGMPRGHRTWFVLRDGGDEPLAEALLHHGAERVTATATRPAASMSFVAFVGLGIRHILGGYDHILFLVGVFGAMVWSWRRAAAVITAFTVAHSLTLALATFHLVMLPSGLVEAAIALSIVWVGVENLLVRQPRHRAATAFGFGLVHGFGFASVLAGLGIARGVAAAVPLFGFNVGVELGQLSIAVLLLPALALVRRRPRVAAIALPALAIAVTTVGALWLTYRTWSIFQPIDARALMG